MQRGRAAGLAFLIAFVTLFVQVLVHRVVSAKLVNNYAFLVISLTMLGFALSGLVLTRWRERFLARLPDSVNLCAAFFAVTLLGATIVFYHAAVGPQFPATRQAFLRGFAQWAPLALLFTAPFVFCGLVLGGLLSSPRLPTRQVYFFDLVGSALGAFAVIPAITAWGVEAGLLGAAGLALFGTAMLAPPRGKAARAAVVLAAAVLATCVGVRQRAFEMAFPQGTMLAKTRDASTGWILEHVAWDPLARMEVSRLPPPDPEDHYFPSLIGGNRDFLSRFRRVLTQNNFAFTYAVEYDGRPESLRGIEETIYAAAYEARAAPAPRVLVIGVGGGFDVLAALHYDASRVVGLEVNGATVDILRRDYRDYFRAWVDDPRVELVHGEGRHYLATHGGEYDVLQLSGVDSYSGTPAAAHVFSENYLYTAEAFDLYLSRLSPHGMLNMMRLEFGRPREMLRALVTAVAALRRAGAAEPAHHVAMVTATGGRFTAMLVKKTPFLMEELDRLEEWGAKSPYFDVSAGPHRNHLRENMYQVFLDTAGPPAQAAFVRGYPFDITPVDDNRPFFFRYSSWSHLFSKDPVVRASVPVMEYSVLLLLGVVGVTAVACVLLPLRMLAGSGLSVQHAGRFAAYFAAAGLGYLAIEVALLQKFGLFLGHPNYALSVVLAALLLASGLGSLISARIVSALGQLRFVSYVLAAVVLADYALVFPRLPGWIGLPFAVRCFIVAALVTPIGVCLGVYVPTALERLKGSHAAFVPWAWGINGVFSVLAPVAAVGLSITWGINALLLAAVPVYIAAGFALPAASDVESRAPEGMAGAAVEGA